jgi:hypothetical protein
MKSKLRDDWPKSPIRAAGAPDHPIYITVPFWRGQLPVMHKVSSHLFIATPDVVTFAALSYVSAFVSREALFEDLAKAHDLYGLQGKPAKLAFPLEWPDDSPGQKARRFAESL